MPTTEELIRDEFGFGADPMAAPARQTSGPLDLPPEPAMKRGRSYDRWLQKRDRAIQDQQLERQDRRDSRQDESEEWRRRLAEERAEIDRQQFRLQTSGAERAETEYRIQAKEKADTNEQVTQAMRSLAVANDMSSLDAAEDSILSAYPLAAQDSSVRAMIENKRQRFTPSTTKTDKRMDPNTALLDVLKSGGLVGPDGTVKDRAGKELGNVLTDGQVDPFKAAQVQAALSPGDKPKDQDANVKNIIDAQAELSAAEAEWEPIKNETVDEDKMKAGARLDAAKAKLEALRIAFPEAAARLEPAKADAPKLSPRDQSALDWANANPEDERAAKIKSRLGVE